MAVTVPDTYVSEGTEILGDRGKYLLFAYDTKGPTEVFGCFCIIKLPPSTSRAAVKIPLENVIPSIVEVCDNNGATDIEAKKYVYGGRECVEIAYTLMRKKKTERCLSYWVKEDTDVYVFFFVADIYEFPRRYGEFSKILSSFQVLEEYRMPGKEISKKVIRGRGVAATVPLTYVSEGPEILGDQGKYLLFAYDTKGPTEVFACFYIIKLPISTSRAAVKIPLENVIPSIVEVYENNGATDIEVKDCVHGNSGCVEIAITFMQEGKGTRILEYWVKEGADVYRLVFLTDISEFSQRYDEFSQIFNSFQILEE